MYEVGGRKEWKKQKEGEERKDMKSCRGYTEPAGGTAVTFP